MYAHSLPPAWRSRLRFRQQQNGTRMIITPVDHPVNWKNPPRLVLGLCLLLTLIFVFWHMADRQREQALDEIYRTRLLSIEWELYETHAGRTRQSSVIPQLKAAYANGDIRPIRRYIGSDDGFIADVQSNGLSYMPPVTFAAWKRGRETFDAERTKVSVQALGVDPEEFRPITFLAYGLVQPDAVHLIMVLVLLLSAGFALELALGSGVVLAGAIGGSVIGAIVYLLINGRGVLPMAGGMVAASTLCGMFLMHFRTSPVVWFGKARQSAVLLALLWLATVVVGYFVSGSRPAEIAAQVAALASGPLWLLVHQRWFTHDTDELEVLPVAAAEEEADFDLIYRESLQKALDAVARLDFSEGQKRLREMVKAYPQDVRVLTQLYHLEKLNPATSAYDAVARRLFGMSGEDVEIMKIYRDYQRNSPEQRALDIETSLKMVARMTRMNEVMEADKLMRKVLEKNSTHPLIPKVAQALGDALDRLQEPTRARFYRQLLNAG